MRRAERRADSHAGRAIAFTNERGLGLPGVYDAIMNRNVRDFIQLEDQLRELFPAVKRLQLNNLAPGKEMAVELTDGTQVSAAGMSEGLLYYLAFAALPYLGHGGAVLIEEPENGLHPERIVELLHTLRKLTEHGTQVILTTHNPLVIDQLEPNEVTVVTRPSVEQGTQATRMSELPNFKERDAAFSLGDMWLAYCDGRTEARLLSSAVTPDT